MASSSGTRCSSAPDPSSGPSYERGAARSALAVCSTGVARARTYNPQSAVGSLDTSAKLIACIAVVVIILSACRGSVGLVTATTITFPADGRRRRGRVLRGGRRTFSSVQFSSVQFTDLPGTSAAAPRACIHAMHAYLSAQVSHWRFVWAKKGLLYELIDSDTHLNRRVCTRVDWRRGRRASADHRSARRSLPARTVEDQAGHPPPPPGAPPTASRIVSRPYTTSPPR